MNNYLAQQFIDLLFRKSNPVKTMGEYNEYHVYEVVIDLDCIVTVIARIDGWDEVNSPIFTVLEYDEMPVSEMEDSISYWNEIANLESDERNAGLAKAELERSRNE